VEAIFHCIYLEEVGQTNVSCALVMQCSAAVTVTCASLRVSLVVNGFIMHPQRKVHQPQRLTNPSTQTLVPRTQDNVHTPSTQEIDEYEIPSSPESNSDAIFQEAMLLATLAERFDCTRFRSYQKDVIQEVLNGRDALVIQPTGSGKSLCFQFPAVHQQKKAVVIVPTISLMEDHFHNLQEKGIPSAYLGSAQTDKGLEDKVFQEDSQEKLFLLLRNG